MHIVELPRGAALVALAASLGLLGACGGGGSGPAPAPSPAPVPAPVKALFVATQPAGAMQGTNFATPPVIHLRSNGVLDPSDSRPVVTVGLVAGSGAAGAHLTGATTATAA